MRTLPLLLVLAACASAPVALPPGEHIGEPIETDAIVHYAIVDADPPAYFDRTVLVEATVVAVCQNKGCWMQIEDAGHSAMVRWYTDCGGKYAFPKDMAGKRVLIQGAFYPKQLSPDDAEHFSQEAGRELDIALDGYELNATAIVVLD
jgi:hypothetical protein